MKILYLTFLLAIVFSFYSCTKEKDFLETTNENQIPADKAWETEKDADQGYIALYSAMLFEGYNKWQFWMFELRSDLGWNESSWRDFANYSKFILPNYNWELNSYYWNDMFKGVGRANRMIADIDKIKDISAAKKQHYIATAKFIRAYSYYCLAFAYGNVPLVLKPSPGFDYNEDEITNKSGSQFDKVLDQVEQDLLDAMPGLPLNVPIELRGTITQGAARALLGKTYMQRHKYQLAADQFKEVVNSGIYSIVPEFHDNFRKENEFNDESIFEITYSNLSPYGWEDYYTPRTPTSQHWSEYITPRKFGGHQDALPNIYYMTSFTDTTVDGKTDPRKLESIWCDASQTYYGESFKKAGGKTDTTFGRLPSIFYLKYNTGYYANTVQFISPINFRVIRYADILLLYAEALNELGQTTDAYQYIDMVRERPSVNVVPLSVQKPGLTQTEMRRQIEHERVVELGGEALRWFDLYRYGHLDSKSDVDTLKKHDYEFKSKPFRAVYDKFLPIPQREIDLSTGKKDSKFGLVQNPGW